MCCFTTCATHPLCSRTFSSNLEILRDVIHILISMFLNPQNWPWSLSLQPPVGLNVPWHSLEIVVQCCERWRSMLFILLVNLEKINLFEFPS